MYEPAHPKPVLPAAKRVNAGRVAQRPPRTEHLKAPLAGHLAALLAVTEELRTCHDGPDSDLDEAIRQITDRIAELSPEGVPARIWEGSQPRADEAQQDGAGRKALLHRKAHALAGRVLVVAASRQDTATAMLACRRMDAHERALGATSAQAM